MKIYPREIDIFNYLFALYQPYHECRIIPQHFVLFQICNVRLNELDFKSDSSSWLESIAMIWI